MKKPAKRIVLATIGSLGDIHPMMALAIELKARGHLPIIATSEAYRRKIENAGIDFHPLRPDLSPQDPEILRHVTDLKNGPEYIVRSIFMPNLCDTYEDLLSVARQCDLMLAGETVFAAPLVSERLQLKWASVILSPSSFFSVLDPPVIPVLPFSRQLYKAPVFVHKLIARLAKTTSKTWCQPLFELRRELGLSITQDPLFEDKFSPFLNLALFSPVIGKPQRDWPSSTKQTGFLFYDAANESSDGQRELDEFLQAGEAPVIFTLGSAAVHAANDFYEISIKAIKQLNRRAIVLTGNNKLKEALPDSIAAFNYLPFSNTLEHASCLVHQGGVGTTAQALCAGIPQLVVPYSLDQPDNASRVERLGCAMTLNRYQYRIDKLATSLQRLLNKSDIASTAEGIATQVKNENGLEQTIRAIEKLI